MLIGGRAFDVKGDAFASKHPQSRFWKHQITICPGLERVTTDQAVQRLSFRLIFIKSYDDHEQKLTRD